MTLEEAEAQLTRAQGYYDAMCELYWQILGWGTSEEIAKAKKKVGSSRRSRDQAQRRVERMARKLQDTSSTGPK